MHSKSNQSRILFIRFAALILLFFCSFSSLARDFYYTYEGQGLSYTVISEEDKTCQTRSGSGSSVNGAGNNISGDLCIPEYAIDASGIKYKVISIGENAFRGCENLKNLELPSTITSIGYRAFEGCIHLTGSLILPNVVEIRAQAFNGCKALDGHLFLGNFLTIIGENAFNGCSSLNGDLTIPNSVTSIGGSAFYGCSGLNGNLLLSKSITDIGEHLFYG